MVCYLYIATKLILIKINIKLIPHTEICKGDSFHSDNKNCIARSLHCNEIDECKDGSDELWSCPSGTFNIGSIYGSLFGYY